MPTHLRLLYYFLRALIRAILNLYYPNTVVLGKRHLKVDGSTLVVSNHPNALMDPLHVVVRVNNPVFFLANASLFRGKLAGAILRTLYCIPIERPKDANGRPTKNDRNFQLCYDHLWAGGNIWIAPEGGSEVERRLRPLKTGTARIALAAAAQMPVSGTVSILPVGLSYFDQGRPGASLVVEAGTPIRVSDRSSKSESPSHEEVLVLTQKLDQQLRTLLIDTRDEREERLLGVAESLLQAAHPLPLAAHRNRSMKLLSDWKHMDADELKKQREQLFEIEAGIQDHGIDDAATLLPKHLPIWARGLLLLIWGPLAWVGWLLHWPVLMIPGRLRSHYDIHPVYRDTVNTVAGLALGLVTYPLYLVLCAVFLGSPATIAMLILILMTGFPAVRWPRYLRRLAQDWRWRQLRRSAKGKRLEKLAITVAEELLAIIG